MRLAPLVYPAMSQANLPVPTATCRQRRMPGAPYLAAPLNVPTDTDPSCAESMDVMKLLGRPSRSVNTCQSSAPMAQGYRAAPAGVSIQIAPS